MAGLTCRDCNYMHVLTRQCMQGAGSWCGKLLDAEEDLWCGALSPLHELYIQVIADEDSKHDFADLFVRLYPRMTQV